MASRNAVITLELVDKVTQNLNKVQRELYKSQRNFKNLESNFHKIGNGMDSVANKGIKAMMAFGGGLVSAINYGSKYSTSVRRINAMNGKQADGFSTLDSTLKKVAIEYGVTANKVAEGAEIITKAGFNEGQVKQMLAPLSMLSKIEPEIPMEQTLESTMETMRILGVESKDSKKYVDTLVYSANASAISVSEMQETIKQAGGMAKMSGMSVDQLATAIQILGNKGVKAQYAGTALRASISNLYANTGQAKDAMEALGIKLKENGKDKTFIELLKEIDEKTRNLSKADRIEKLSKLFGKEHVDKMSKLTESMRTFDEEVTKTAGRAKDSAEKFYFALNPLQFTIEKLKATGSVVITEFVQGLTDLNNKTGIFTDLLNKVENFFKITDDGKKVGEGWKWVDRAVEGTAFLLTHLKEIGIVLAGLKIGKGIMRIFEFGSKVKQKEIEVKLKINKADKALLRQLTKASEGGEIDLSTLSGKERRRAERALKRNRDDDEFVEVSNTERVPTRRERRRERVSNATENIIGGTTEALVENAGSIGEEDFMSSIAQDALGNIIDDAQDSAQEAVMDRVKGAFNKVFKGEGGIKEVGVKKYVGKLLGKFKGAIGAGLTTLFPTLVPKIVAGMTALAPIIAGAMPIIIGACVVALGALLWKFRKPIVNGVKKLGNTIKTHLGPVIDSIKTKFGELKTSLGNKLISKVSDWTGLSEEQIRSYCTLIKEEWQKVKNKVSEKIEGVVDFVKDSKEKFSEGCTKVKTWWSETKTKLKEKAEATPEVKKAKEFWDKCRDTRNAWEKTKKSLAQQAWAKIKLQLPENFVTVVEKCINVWERAKSVMSNPIQAIVNLIDKKSSQRSARRNQVSSQGAGALPSVGSFAVGIKRVPYDNFPAFLHKDERVLTKREADHYRNNRHNNAPTYITNNVEVKARIDKDIDIDFVANEIARRLEVI